MSLTFEHNYSVNDSEGVQYLQLSASRIISKREPRRRTCIENHRRLSFTITNTMPDPILLGDLVFILPQDVDKCNWQEDFMVRALEKKYCIQIRLGFIQKERDFVGSHRCRYSNAIPNIPLSRVIRGTNYIYIELPPREGVRDIYYNRAVMTERDYGPNHTLSL